MESSWGWASSREAQQCGVRLSSEGPGILSQLIALSAQVGQRRLQSLLPFLALVLQTGDFDAKSLQLCACEILEAPCMHAAADAGMELADLRL